MTAQIFEFPSSAIVRPAPRWQAVDTPDILPTASAMMLKIFPEDANTFQRPKIRYAYMSKLWNKYSGGTNFYMGINGVEMECNFVCDYTPAEMKERQKEGLSLKDHVYVGKVTTFIRKGRRYNPETGSLI